MKKFIDNKYFYRQFVLRKLLQLLLIGKAFENIKKYAQGEKVAFCSVECRNVPMQNKRSFRKFFIFSVYKYKWVRSSGKIKKL